MFDRRLVQNFDWSLLGLAFMLGFLGLVTLYSAVTAGTQAPQIEYYKQLIWYFVGLIFLVISFLFNYKNFYRWGYIIYLLCVSLLVVVLIFGEGSKGAMRWLKFGFFSIQPSEPVKLALIIILARYYAKHSKTEGLTLRELINPFLMTIIPFILIVKQPDLGTAIMIVLITGSMTVFIKIERRSFLYLIFSFIISVPLVWFFLREYQKARILTFLDPDRDPLGTGYHIIQSKIAIGSGMISGKGFLEGTQNALSFLPEQHTDFIFSVLAEEWGLIGPLIILIVFLILIIKGLSVAYRCREPFGTILSVGVTAMIFWQVIINIGMVMGLFPVVGVTLPFISYGGSSLITVMICIGILINISMRRFMVE